MCWKAVLLRGLHVADPPTGEITFLATDIEGSVELWQRNEAAMSVALARHDRLLRAIVPQHDGQVIKGSGDGIWSVFTHPRRALDAALTIQAAIRSATWDDIGGLRVRIAVHSGEAELRDGDYFGPTANRLARLLERVRGGQILVSEPTVRLTGAEAWATFEVLDIGELRLRNFREPLRAFELVVPGDDGTKRAEAGFGATAFVPSYSFPSPGQLVGRSSEVDLLWSVLERGRESGQIVLISAQAGTGKSTLVGELVRRARASGVLCLAGGAYERAGVVPLGPARDALADYLLSQPADHLGTFERDVLADLASVVPGLAYQFPDLGQISRGPDLGRISGAITACLRALADRHPVMLCLEDLHVADDGTIGLIRHLVQQTSKLRLTICATFRSDEVQPGGELGNMVVALARAGATTINLAPLDRQQTGQLIANLLDGPIGERLSDSLFAATEGNPLFLEQLVHALREAGQISRTGRVWYGTDGGPLKLSSIVRDVLGERLHRLDRRCYDTVGMAAVLGQTFEYEALSAALDPPTMLSLVEDLEEAARAHVLREVPSGYAFTHPLLRETIYDALSAPRRMLFHRQAGEALQRLAGGRADEYAAELAHHFLRAGNDPSMRAKTLQFSLTAGRHAARFFLHNEVLIHFTRVCELLDSGAVPFDQEVLLEALFARQNAERALGRWLPLIATCERILACTVDPIVRAQARGSLGHARQRLNDTAAAIRECDSALAELASVADRPDAIPTRLDVLTDKAYLLFLQGRFEEQSALGTEMLAIAHQLGLPKPLQWAHNVLGLANLGRGQVTAALSHFQRFLETALHANDALDEALAHSNLGIQYQYAGEFESARAQLERAIQLCREAEAEPRAINSIQRLGWVLVGLGDLDGALRQAEWGHALASSASDRWAADCQDLLGTIFSLRGDWSIAASHFEEALRLRERGPHIVGRIETLLGLGTTRQRAGDWDDARRAFVDALTLAGQIDPSPWLVAASRHLGQLRVLLGESEGVDLISRALTLAETMPRSVELAPTLLAAVECGRWRDDAPGALAALQRALAANSTVETRIELLCVLARHQREHGMVEEVGRSLDDARSLAARLGSPRITQRVQEATVEAPTVGR